MWMPGKQVWKCTHNIKSLVHILLFYLVISSTIRLAENNIFGDKLFHFILQLVPETLFCYNKYIVNFIWDAHPIICSLHVKHLPMLLDFNQNWDGLTNFRKTLQYENSSEPLQWVLSCYMHTDMLKVLRAFLSLAVANISITT
jgi:hypothetical protein